MRVARFLASGELDDSFGVDGIRRIRFGGDADAAGLADLELERDGSIIVAGSRAPTNAAIFDFAAVKLTPNGALDQSFANGGVKLIHRRGNDVSGRCGHRSSWPDHPGWDLERPRFVRATEALGTPGPLVLGRRSDHPQKVV